ncbi:MAG: hypothetical protein KC729_13265, partial [Candidatus Eisenbacteria bacterium]|nr:hypothetical protein [Candidatus Eisenbacteria bacterium]
MGEPRPPDGSSGAAHAEADPVSQLEALLALPAEPDLLDRWAASRAPDPLRHFYQIAMQGLGVAPDRVLDAVRHLRTALPEGTLARDALLARLEAHGLRGVGRASASVTLYARAASLYARLGDRAEQVRTAVGWSFALALAGDPREAERVGRGARALLGPGEAVLGARLDTNVATAWQLAGSFDRATMAFQRAFAVLRDAGMAADAGLVAHNLGSLALMSGHADAAELRCREALLLFGTASTGLQPLYSRTILAAVDLTRGRWNEALAAIGMLREDFEQRGDARARAWLHRELAHLFASVGALEAALPEAEAAVGIFREAALTVDAAHTAVLFGRLLARQGQTQAAAAELANARVHFAHSDNRAQLHRVDLERARLQLASGDPTGALATLAPARAYLEKRDPQGDGALARAVAGEIHLHRNHPRLARRLLERAYRDVRRHPAKLERPRFAILAARAATDPAEVTRWTRRALDELERNLLRFGTRQMRV